MLLNSLDADFSHQRGWVSGVHTLNVSTLNK